MEATAFVLEVADGCWAAGIRDPGSGPLRESQPT
jgi:hypothetical protein